MLDTVSFSISRWSAWAPGVSTPDAWRDWAAGVTSLEGEGNPKIVEFPAMLTRRASRADRLALRAALDCCAGLEGSVPTVFASRHGEVHRSVELFEALAAGAALSPTSFSLSVHNAAAGLYSMGRQDRAPSTALAASDETLPMAVLEAVGMLEEGAPRVLVVVYDEPLPDVFQPYLTERDPCAAVALLLQRASGPRFSLEVLPLEGSAAGAEPADGDAPARTPSALNGELVPFLRFLASEQREVRLDHATRSWRWRRTA